MRYREFWQLVDEVFGRAYGRTLASDQVLDALGSRTAAQAVEDGVEPRVVWHALCDAMDVPEPERWGTDAHRQAPPAR
ncbi:DUF3046 domain-containing protein [Sanguibacter suaedae]|uniref:DUF3046 domain-containing protein n=1 Tax=Sanguibacter suaedae TaxID=2795737 RepID=A0A934IBS9_9MICO|nr:DUF3046 domain-containing protein [Sanguibacter suaedae]MBI9115507.1 DUF3046 domain-containing protein [Sanguibacter suaedae]